MKRLPKLGQSVWMTDRNFTGSGYVVDVFSNGEAADITIRDIHGRCWTAKKEKLHKPKTFGRCPNCNQSNVTVSPDEYCDYCHEN
jgi:Zn finger protein HypA/HybF involved in hydrogenase expression